MANKKDTKPRNDEIMNYLFRPAKNIERKMLCEALSRLSVLTDVKDYQYVGFGSVYFADFTLFHKILGIQKLISIEGEEAMEARVRFNQPYSCIDVLPGWSYEMLQEIDWVKNKSILWLDYTEGLKGYMFNDMSTFFNRAQSGSVFIMSINVDLKEDEVVGKTTSEKILNRLTKYPEIKKRIRTSDLQNDIKKEGYYTLLRKVIEQEIHEIISDRNKIEDKEKFSYKQIFNFLYKDGQAMLTVGGIFFSEKDKDKIDEMNFGNLDFVMESDSYYEIRVPNLTSREIHALDKHLPNFNTDSDAKQKAFAELKNVVSTDAINDYAKIYRYYPNYSESNL